MRLPKQIDPEKNRKVRAVLFAIGIGGSIHLSVLFISALVKGNIMLFNPLLALDVDKIWPSIENTPWTLLIGWFSLIGGSIAAYYLLTKSKDSND